MNTAAFCRSALTLAMLSTFLAARPAVGSGFALYEQSASGLGNAYAGVAAAGEDASTIFWNPAGMSRLPLGKQLVIAGHAIMPSTEFGNSGSVAAGGQTLGNNGGNAGDLAIIPNFYFAMDLVPRVKFGLGVNVPFGLSTKYEPDWIGRFQGIEAEFQTLNINPSISWKASDAVSVGAGLSYQAAKLDLLTGVNYTALGALILVPVAPGTQGQNRVKVDDNGSWGWNAGLVWELNPSTRLGLAYRSSIKHDASGATRFSNVPAGIAANPVGGPRTADGNVRLTAKLPDSLAVSVFHQLDAKWDLLGDFTWTGWDKLQALNIVRDTGVTLSTLSLLFKNTQRYSVGANYRWSSAWTLKFGLALDESPVKNAGTRTVRLPDNDRTWLSIGAKYQMSKSSTVDLGYTFIKVRNAPINQIQNVAGVSSNGNVIGNYKASVNLLSAQYTYSF